MVLKIKHYVTFVTFAFLASCSTEPKTLTKIQGKLISVSPEVTENDSINTFISPFRNKIESELNKIIAYAPENITKTDGKYNTSLGNLMAKIVYEEANPVYKFRTNNEIDFVLLNHGGIRANISKGNITVNTAYEIMPFENSITVVKLKGSTVSKLIKFLIEAKKPHPIYGIQIALGKNSKESTVLIQNKPFDENKIYNIATSNYLVNGGDNMSFFDERTETIDIEYKIRNAIIYHFKKYDTIVSKTDDRFYTLK